MPYREGGGLPVVGAGGGRLMTHSAGSVTVTIQTITFKYVNATEPYR
jgi:hypothetical protein